MRSSVHESQWFPDECRRIEQSFKKLDLQILGWEDEDQDPAIRSNDHGDLEDDRDVVIRKTFEMIEMKDLPPMQHPDRSQPIFMVRPCYLKLFDLIMKKARMYVNANIVVTGNPGIGKSRFYLYFIWRLIKEGLPKKFSHLVINCGGEYHVYEDKEFVMLLSKREISRFKNSAGVLRLVDGWSDRLEGWHGTSVLFAAPGAPNMHQFKKAIKGFTFVMPPWGLEELLICNEACELGLSAEEIRKEFSYFGGIPRFIFSQNEEWRSEVEGAILSSDCQGILKYVKEKSEVLDEHYSQYIFKMVPRDEDTFKRATLDFLSEQIGDRVIDQIERKSPGALRSFVLEAQDDSDTSLFRGRVYEKLCHRALTSNVQTVAARHLI